MAVRLGICGAKVIVTVAIVTVAIVTVVIVTVVIVTVDGRGARQPTRT
jgi:hypothetical protein